MKVVPEKEVLQEIQDRSSIKKEEIKVEKDKYRIKYVDIELAKGTFNIGDQKAELFKEYKTLEWYKHLAETKNYVKTELKIVSISIRSCYKKANRVKKDENVEFEIKKMNYKGLRNIHR
ncbi:hypothetical protein C2G38_2177944 [Gigaspora rosea]|uniref:Uncharacterized protein n=1 Tax=Gigaspora rosea TaxID=44941 RepID=A0A397VET1_9GLOM|nr:hypothetical protein C2G38_2177944 [Gigaspora rosea]